jgi:hypothetical protein
MYENLIKKIESSFEYILLDSYNKDIQHVLDHFGVGKLLDTFSVYCLKIDKNFIPLVIITTSQGDFVFIEIPVTVPDARKILDTITERLELQTPVFTQTNNERVNFAHIEKSYFALRKL